MEWIDKIDGVDIIYAEDINKLAHLSIDASETAKNVAYVGENGNWFIYDAVTKKYVDSGKTAEGKQGESGLPDRVVYTDINYYEDVFNNTHCEAVFTDAYVEGTFQINMYPFKDNLDTDADPTKSSSITVSFNCVEGLTFALYAFAKDGSAATIVWSGAEPTFTPGYTYFLSFVPLSDTRILGAWSEVPTV